MVQSTLLRKTRYRLARSPRSSLWICIRFCATRGYDLWTARAKCLRSFRLPARLVPVFGTPQCHSMENYYRRSGTTANPRNVCPSFWRGLRDFQLDSQTCIRLPRAGLLWLRILLRSRDCLRGKLSESSLPAKTFRAEKFYAEILVLHKYSWSHHLLHRLRRDDVLL